VTITGGTLSAEAGQFSGDLQTSTRISATSGSNAITITPNVGGTQNRIETTGTLPLSLVSAAAITMAAGGTTPQITLATTGAVTLTGALSGTSATMSGLVTGGTGLRATGGTDAGSQLSLFANGSGNTFIAGFDINFNTGSNNSRTTCLTLASTGAATFSKSVTVESTGIQATIHAKGGGDASGQGKGNFRSSDFGGGNYWDFGRDNLTTGDFVITNFGSSPYLRLATLTGAATFSSSVTANGLRLNGGDSTNTIYAGSSNMGITSESGYNIFIGRVSNTIIGLNVNTSSGNVGIGTASPDAGLTIETASNSFNALALRDSRAFNASPEAALAFRVKFNSSGAFATPALLVAYKDNATDGNQAGGLQFYTNGNSGATERMRITSDGYARLSTSSGGIQFNGDTAAANALDDYEEGTWTPVVQIGATVNTASVTKGRYTKIGNVVYIQATITGITKSGTGNLTIAGLPFTVGPTTTFGDTQGTLRWDDISSSGVIYPYFSESNTFITMQDFSTTGYVGIVNDTQISSSYQLYGISGFYMV
jgi:hypothetical protein